MEGRLRRTRTADLVLIALLIVIVVTAYLLLRDGGDDQVAANTATVQRGTVETSVSASGSVESSMTRQVNFATSGTVTAIVVDVGDRVSAGRVLARVGASTARADLQSAYANTSSARAGVASAQSGVTSAQANVTSAQANLSAAQANLAEIRHADGSTDAQIADAEAKVASARSQLAQAEASVTSANAQVQQAEASLRSAEASVTQAEASVSDTSLVAPVSGTVVEINGVVGQDASSAGSATASTTAGASTSSGTSDTSGFIVISDLKDLEVRAYFSETDTAELKVGQKATVTFDALGTSVPAVVRSIDVTSTVQNNVVDYGVTLRLWEQPRNARPGQTATVEIVTARAKNALYVPSAAVQTIGTGSVVTVVRDGSDTQVSVTVGIEGDQTTQITSGLSEGQTVVIPTTTGSSGFPSGGFPGIGVGGGGGGPPGGGG